MKQSKSHSSIGQATSLNSLTARRACAIARVVQSLVVAVCRSSAVSVCRQKRRGGVGIQHGCPSPPPPWTGPTLGLKMPNRTSKVQPWAYLGLWRVVLASLVTRFLTSDLWFDRTVRRCLFCTICANAIGVCVCVCVCVFSLVCFGTLARGTHTQRLALPWAVLPVPKHW